MYGCFAAANSSSVGASSLHPSFQRDLTWIVLFESDRLLEENVAQHEAILAAIERHDPVDSHR